MWRSLHDAWWRLALQGRPSSAADAVACGLLEAGATLYGGLVRARNAAYDRGWVRPVRLPCRVISIGNLAVGGTGKTACVEWVARAVATSGHRVAILSRGYGGGPGPYGVRWEQGRLDVRPLDGRLGPRREDGVADEPQLLAQHLAGVPVLVGAKRSETGYLACAEFQAQVLVLDDAFQHRQLARDCDIVLIDAQTPLGGGSLFPRGPMREPLASLRRADIIVITKAERALGTVAALRERAQALAPAALVVTATHAPATLLDAATGARRDPHGLRGVRVGLCSSIGDPDGFEDTMRGLDATVVWHQRFPDHHRYQPADWAAIAARLGRERPAALVTTEKDWIRLQPVVAAGTPSPVPVLVLTIAMQVVEGNEAFHARLARVCVGTGG